MNAVTNGKSTLPNLKNDKDMVYVLMKEVNLVIQLLKMVLPILQTVETY